jgi:hypothetical protein
MCVYPSYLCMRLRRPLQSRRCMLVSEELKHASHL